MPVRFIHTADWQIGKPFAWVSDADKRGKLQGKRLEAVQRIGEQVEKNKASFVVVAGDLFDSPSPINYHISSVCSLIGSMKVPVFVIPGNHDHGGPMGLWDKPFFMREMQKLAPNLHVLLESKPIEVEDAILLPCPLLRRHESIDPTAWLRSPAETFNHLTPGKPRIVIAHGSIQDFGTVPDEDEGTHSTSVNRLELEKLPTGEIDYVALGDWHGAKSINDKAWYSGTPESDRFDKGVGYEPGNILLVSVSRGSKPSVEKIPVSKTRWHDLEFSLNAREDVDMLESRIDELTGGSVDLDLMKLRLQGLADLEGFSRLESLYETFRSRFISLRLEDKVILQPSQEELQGMTTQSDDPLTAQVANRLVEIMGKGGEESEVATFALRELYIAYKNKI
jgi:DNA repair exonuclease SbcCD nuclease subunit